MKPQIVGNHSITICKIQDSRIWIHSTELGYGKWITNKELKGLIESNGSQNPNNKSEVKNE